MSKIKLLTKFLPAIMVGFSLLSCSNVPSIDLNLVEKGRTVVKETDHFDEAIYPNIKKLQTLLNLEKDIDYQAVNLEREQLIDRVSKTASKEELNNVLRMARKVQASPDQAIQKINEYYFQKRLFADINNDQEKYPNLVKYNNYLSILLDIDYSALKKELDDYEKVRN